MASTITMSRSFATQPTGAREDRSNKRKKEQRTDIWSGLLRQTREAQARNRTQAVQHRELIVCGGSPEDQRVFLQSISRAPPPQALSRNQERKQQRPKGELRLSNQYAYGYGHVTLFSPPQQTSAGVQVLGAESEEVARIELHTIPRPEEAYVGTLRNLLRVNTEHSGGETLEIDHVESEQPVATEPRRPPGVCILLSWKEPWKFLSLLQRWLQLFAQALLTPEQAATDPLDVIKDAHLALTVVVQHTETQEALFREGYKEEDFDYISQCLRTAILPLHPMSALLYTNLSGPPQQPGSQLSETQKVVYMSLGLDLAVLSAKVPRSSDGTKKEEIGPKHEFMDRMAIVIPGGWDSAAFIRTLSETFSPEDLLNAWLADLQPVIEPAAPPMLPAEGPHVLEDPPTKQTNGAPEVFESSSVHDSSDEALPEPPMSPSKLTPSAVRTYETKILDPQAHKAPRPPTIDVTTKADQKFLAEMRAHLQELESQDREREATRGSSGVSNTSLSGSSSGRVVVGVPGGEQSGALNELGDVSFNVGGVSYDTVSAEAAIERLKRPTHGGNAIAAAAAAAAASSSSGSVLMDPTSPIAGSTRTSTPKPHRQPKDGSGKGADPTIAGMQMLGVKDGGVSSTGSASSAGAKAPGDTKDLPIDKLEEYFHSLMKKGGGLPGASRESTPSRSRGE